MATIDFDGRVAVVTGAGGGLGRQHALLLASRGARVVVNDLGGARDGQGSDTSAADSVVAEIQAAGGDAVADHHGVDDWANGDHIVATALEAFGRIDIVINNAGILRDRSFGKLAMEDYSTVVAVHLQGAFAVTRAAWNHFKAQSYGRIVNTSSGSGIYGNFGQANYGAAKMALVGLTRTLAIEGARYGITCNAIAPIASSRMTEDAFPPHILERLTPEHVAGLVAFLASETCTDSGGLYSVGGGHIARIAIMEAAGVTFDHAPSPDEIAAQWTSIQQLSDAAEFSSVNDQMLNIARAAGISVT